MVRNEDFKTKEYWEMRYKEEDGQSFDWFKDYNELQDIFDREIPSRNCSIIMLGCGNSQLSHQMHTAGYKNIFNIDFSDTVISQMKKRYPDMQWHVMDVQNMFEIGDETFDVAIDKGTMDALMCEKGDVWNPSEDLIKDVKREVDEVVRILKPGGTFVYVTFGQPHFRRIHLERPGIWDLKIEKIGDAFHYFVYIMKKI